jgi:hypothetical protein
MLIIYRFYLKAKKALPTGLLNWSESKIWFDNQPLGKNTIAKMFSDITEGAGVQRRTNHSARVTNATRKFNAGCSTQEVKLGTGHRSDAVEVYCQPGIQMLKRHSEILAGDNSKRIKINDAKESEPDQISKSAFTDDSDNARKKIQPSSVDHMFKNLKNCTINIQF